MAPEECVCVCVRVYVAGCLLAFGPESSPREPSFPFSEDLASNLLDPG